MPSQPFGKPDVLINRSSTLGRIQQALRGKITTSVPIHTLRHWKACDGVLLIFPNSSAYFGHLKMALKWPPGTTSILG